MMRSKTRCLVISICIVIAIAIAAVMFWPLTCSRLIQPEHGDITIYIVTPDFSSSTSIPTFTSEQWTVPSNSDEYAEILEIMGKYHCHRKIRCIEQDDHQSWITMYSESGLLILEYRGTDDFNAGNTHYSLYGEGNGQAMMNAIHSFLLSQQ